MALRNYESAEQAEAVAKEVLWLAWTAAGHTYGTGFLQDNPDANKDAVWNNAYNHGDYPGGRKHNDPARIDADYVFGRMLKLRFRAPTTTSIDVPEHEPRGDYQSWAYAYKTYAALFDAAEQVVLPKIQTA